MLLWCDCTEFEADQIESQSRQVESVPLIRWSSSVTSGGESASSVLSVSRSSQVLLDRNLLYTQTCMGSVVSLH